ncbi:uncharacterized protein KZ484_014580 [Pholidichthys leucotaenia]
MDAVFMRFDSYNFEADQRFVEGLNTVGTSRVGAELLSLKLFYYNRFVEPIDSTCYKQQCSPAPRVTDSGCDNQQSDQRTSLQPDCGISDKQTPELPSHVRTKQLSFAEVMQLVQEGKEVPGVTKLDIQPSNQSPTRSQMKRIVKPWETSSALE